ncbi:hypothetical protein KY285_021405 [Solanum tuberosum]|nr:hypothetical protein KY289_021679 [Solanum tuberosum]KAH0694308.1 hypothetical protein KY285_021405 [Solanum tuberosum]
MQCKVCMQTFICTTSEVKCREHAEAKHPKSDGRKRAPDTDGKPKKGSNHLVCDVIAFKSIIVV